MHKVLDVSPDTGEDFTRCEVCELFADCATLTVNYVWKKITMKETIQSWLDCGFSDIAMQFHLNIATQENLAFSVHEARLIFLREYDALLENNI